jgi:hypothetical protein
MTIRVSIFAQHDYTFNGVEAVTFHSGAANITGQPVAQWTKYGEEGGSEELVNVDLSLVSLDSIAYIYEELNVFVRAI